MGRYLEDFQLGEWLQSPTRTVTEADVLWFSALSGDYNELHTSASYAARTPFGQRVMQGLLGLALSHGLLFRMGFFDGTGLALLEVDDWKFLAPVFLGETVFVRVRADDIRRSRSKPDRGVVRLFVQLCKEPEVVVQEGYQVVMLRARGGEP